MKLMLCISIACAGICISGMLLPSCLNPAGFSPCAALLLDDKDRQVGTSSVPVVSRYPADEKFAVLANGEGADWSTRKYFRTAINNPGQVQISEEYFSIPDGAMCITLSVACQLGRAVQVFCCDLNWD